MEVARVGQRGVSLSPPFASPYGAQPREWPVVQSVAPSWGLGPPGVEAGPRGGLVVQAGGGGVVGVRGVA